MGALGINLPGLIAQIINFTLLLLLLYFVLYKPILRMLDRRSEKIRESMERAEQIKKDAERSEQEIKKRLEVAHQEGQALVTQAAEIGEKLKTEAREEAKKEGEALITKARAEIQRERDEAIEQVRQRFAELAILAAEKVINRSLDKQAHVQLIQEVLEESSKKGKSQES
ncbi:MAG: F0F1 ATP synthase subunit B [Chloroflexi bacterium]|nr:F0F1 ATP synthase subunit B [Chloroflexota bacterium]